MELRHLRYFLAVTEAATLTEAAARLHLAQPALSRQIHDLEEEIGVDLFIRSARGVTLTAEGKLFRTHAQAVLAQVEEALQKTRALARGEYGELHVGYAATPTLELLPPTLAAFQAEVPGVHLHLHDLGGNELVDGLRSRRLELAVMQQPLAKNAVGLMFESLRRYHLCVALPPAHRLTRLKSVPLARLQAERLVVFRHQDYADYHQRLADIWPEPALRPAIAVECDGANSLISAVAAGRGVAILPQIFAHTAGRRLRFRPLTPPPPDMEVGIVRAQGGDLTPAGEKFCAFLRRQT